MTTDPTAPSDAALLRRLFAENARPHLRGYALAFLFMALTAAATAASAWIMRDVINEIFVDRRAEMVGPVAGAVMTIFLIKGFATFGQSLVLSRIGARLVAGVQMRIMDNLLAQGMTFHDRVAAADLTTRMSYNAAAARDLINTLVTAVGRDALAIVALTGVMVAQNPGMALAALLIGPPAVLGVSMLVRRVRKLARREFASLARIVGVMNEFSRGVRVIKAFGLEPRIRAEMEAAVRDVERRTIGIAKLNALSSPLMETLGGLAIAAVIVYAGYSVIGQGSDAGAFFAFLTAFLMAYDPAKRLARLNVSVQQQLVAVRLLYDLLDTPSSLTDCPGAMPLPTGPGRVTFDDVRFGYAASPALNGLTFAAEPGQVTALVGPSGAGKTTVFSLLARFYDADAGAVAIDGRDLRDLTQASLRTRLAVVGQDAFLFNDTIRENIRRGRSEADDAAVEAAARDANVWEFAAALPEGLDTVVGEAGGRLSGGQRQRVAIARAMVRDAPILLLDEATSALDAEAEAAVQEALDRLMVGRTTLVIAHRLATIRRADRIIVMREGRAEEIGDHASLYAAGGLYRRLCDLQFGAAD
jgi:subfamily B ATP-binding cassette protein MsbA